MSIDGAVRLLSRRLLDKRTAPGHWDGCLSSSALATGTAVLALATTVRNGYRDPERVTPLVRAGAAWLARYQNGDGGWGDTVRSRSNISTTAIVWATLSSLTWIDDPAVAPAVERATVWLRDAAGGITPERLRSAILGRYGKDRTFSVPILMVLALTNKLGEPGAAWRSIPQLPFELAALPHTWFQHLRLPVVSYALPALIAIGQVRHHFAPSRNPVTRVLRNRVRARTHSLLRAMQPDSGGYLEATPLTSFVVMSLAGMGQTASPVVEAGVRFLVDSMRRDGSWPIDTNLATWVTTLSIDALAEAETVPASDMQSLRTWLLDQQSTREHPFTHAARGAWAWTPLSGGVPDSDDTAGALLALHRLGDIDAVTIAAAASGIRWLLGVQNRDGGIPTFCRGWGTLPFDRSTPEITGHAMQAWSAWLPHLDERLQRDLRSAAARAVRFLAAVQRADGSWIPLWFGNEDAPAEDNPVYGTARVLSGLQTTLAANQPGAAECRDRARRYLLESQNGDGGWGGSRGVRSSIEETGVVLRALSRSPSDADERQLLTAVTRGARWLIDATSGETEIAAPVGLYFARLWYYEELYPAIFALGGLASAHRAVARQAEI
jgi:squalene-hopene/tetraprenyl-beta-curcumene cyclase